MSTDKVSLFKEKHWDVIDAAASMALMTAVGAIHMTRGKVAVKGRRPEDASRLVHTAFFEADLFQLTLKPSFRAGDMARKVRQHKVSFDAKPDAIVIEDIKEWSNEALAEVGEWVKRRKAPLFITIGSEGLPDLDVKLDLLS